jgi:hypothetical protein
MCPNARKLSHKAPVKAWIAELHERAAERAVVGIEWLQHKFVEIIQGKAVSRIGVRDGKPFEEVDRLAAMVGLMRTLGIGEASVNLNAVAAAGNVCFDPNVVTDEDRVRALGSISKLRR